MNKYNVDGTRLTRGADLYTYMRMALADQGSHNLTVSLLLNQRKLFAKLIGVLDRKGILTQDEVLEILDGFPKSTGNTTKEGDKK